MIKKNKALTRKRPQLGRKRPSVGIHKNGYLDFD